MPGEASAAAGAEGASREVLGGLLIGLASLQFGIVVILGDIVQNRGLPVFTMLAVRFAFAAALLAAVLAAMRQPLLPARGERLWLAVLAMAGYAVEASFFFAALDHGKVAAVTLLFFTYPVFVALGSMALGQGMPGPLVGLSMACAVAGAAIVVATSGSIAITGIGVVFALMSALTFTGYLLGADRVMRRTAPLAASMWVSVCAAVALVVYALVSGQAEVPSGGPQWARLAGMGAATAGAFVCLLAGLRRLGPVRTAIVAATEPLASAVLAYVFLDQRIGVGVAAGGALILVGAVAASLARARPPTEPPVP